jgi:hypothetical protein
MEDTSNKENDAGKNLNSKPNEAHNYKGRNRWKDRGYGGGMGNACGSGWSSNACYVGPPGRAAPTPAKQRVTSPERPPLAAGPEGIRDPQQVPSIHDAWAPMMHELKSFYRQKVMAAAPQILSPIAKPAARACVIRAGNRNI